MDKIKFWCQKILPLVYDDSLSYYELLCKIVNAINEIIESINDGLTSYIDKYFNSIMITATYDEKNETIYLGKEVK